ncbi:MAG: hypothetical protein GY847_27845 [Proteobacteria bacterium]|nr:hypothetical protein [Pseudomonadota bacterium]
MSIRYIMSALAAVSFVVTTANTASTQTVEDWRAAEDGTNQPPPQIDPNYHGVIPGSGNNLPRVEELKGKSGTWVTWPGFFMLEDGGSRFFLQTTVSVDYTTEKKKKRLILKLKNTKVYLSNNRNPLVTEHFNTPVTRIYLKKRRKRVDLVIELKVDSSPQITQTVDQDGYHYLFIDFPPGDYPKAQAPDGRPAFSSYAPTLKSVTLSEPK